MTLNELLPNFLALIASTFKRPFAELKQPEQSVWHPVFICTMESAVSPALVDFICKESAVGHAETITAQTRLQDDLGVYGDDATDLLLAYAKTFHVDVSCFMAADYFDGEGVDVLAWFRLVKPRRKDLTVGHLQQGIDAQRLDEAIIQGA